VLAGEGAGRIAGHTVAAYSVTGQTIARLRDGS